MGGLASPDQRACVVRFADVGGCGRSALARAVLFLAVRTTFVFLGDAARLAVTAVRSSWARKPMPSMTSRVLACAGPTQVSV